MLVDVFLFKRIMILETELFEIGFRRFGDEENDPYYKVILDRSVFGLSDLAGNLDQNGNFEIYSMHNRKFNKILEIKQIIEINKLVVNWDIMNIYGSCVPL